MPAGPDERVGPQVVPGTSIPVAADSTPGLPGSPPLVPTVAAPAPGDGTAEARYSILRHVASGGMGDVYEAHDRELNRRVALKKLGAGLVASAEGAERFRREALAAAGLDHPNIVPVYDAGRHEGRPFFTMAFVDGESLAARVRARGPLAPDEAVRVMLPVVEAVGYAHAHHVVHRDLKPENVLIDARGRPRVTDFGLARQMLDPGDLTGSSQLLGTPRYMAPEQARPAVGPVGPATDVYALGGVLVFLLTGRAPVGGDSLPEVLLNVLDQPPLLPRDVRPDVPAALNEVCRRCLRKKPADRYPDAAALHAALAAVDAGGSAVAPPAPRRRLHALLAVLAVGLLAAAVAIGVKNAKPRDEQPDAGGAETPATKKSNPTPDPIPNPDPSPSPKANPGPTPALIPIPNPGPSPPKLRADPELFTLAGHSGRVWVSFAPDSRSLVSWGDDATLRVWDVATGKQVKSLLRDKASTMDARWSPDGKTLAVALSDGHARVFTLPEWEQRLVYRDDAQGVTAVAFSPDGGRLAVGTDGGGLKLFDTKTWAEAAECVGHSQRVLARGLFFSADGRRLVSASRDDSVRVWDAATGKKLHTLADRNDLWAVVPAPDPGRLVVVQTHLGSKYVRVVEADSGKVAKDFGEEWVSDYALAPDGKVLWAVGDFGTHAWDLAALRVAGTSEKARGDSLAFVPGAGRLLVGHDNTHRTRVVVYKVDDFSLERLRVVQEHRTDVTAVAVSPDARLAATADEAGTIKLWDVPTLTRP